MMRDWSDRDPGDPVEERRLRRWLAVFIFIQVAAFAAFAWPLFARSPGSVPIVPAGRAFDCTAIAVWDGDGPIWCAEGPRVRLAGIAARELDNSCRPHHPCPAAGGVAARDALVTLLGGPRGALRTGHIRVGPILLSCRSTGWAKGDRTAARCTRAGRDLATQLTAAGVAARW